MSQEQLQPDASRANYTRELQVVASSSGTDKGCGKPLLAPCSSIMSAQCRSLCWSAQSASLVGNGLGSEQTATGLGHCWDHGLLVCGLCCFIMIGLCVDSMQTLHVSLAATAGMPHRRRLRLILPPYCWSCQSCLLRPQAVARTS